MSMRHVRNKKSLYKLVKFRRQNQRCSDLLVSTIKIILRTGIMTEKWKFFYFKSVTTIGANYGREGWRTVRCLSPLEKILKDCPLWNYKINNKMSDPSSNQLTSESSMIDCASPWKFNKSVPLSPTWCYRFIK